MGLSFDESGVSELEERAKSLIEGELGTVVRDGVMRLLSAAGKGAAENEEALKW